MGRVGCYFGDLINLLVALRLSNSFKIKLAGRAFGEKVDVLKGNSPKLLLWSLIIKFSL